MSVKCAVAFFGLPRNSEVCFPSIQKNIYGSLPDGAVVRSFYHLYEQERIDNPRSNEKEKISSSNYVPFKGMEGELEKPGLVLEKWNFKYFHSLGDTWGDEGISIKNLIHQLHSLRQVTLLIEESGMAPDFVIFVRPDLIYHNEIPKHVFKSFSHNYNSVYVPGWQWWKGLNDRFAICGKESYKSYGKRIEEAMNYCTSGDEEIHAEKLLKYALYKSRSKIKFLKSYASRVRVNGEIVDEDFSGNKQMGKRENRVLIIKAKLNNLFDKIFYG